MRKETEAVPGWNGPGYEVMLVYEEARKKFKIVTGYCDQGEQPIDAAIREILEETGMRVDPSTVELLSVYTCNLSRWLNVMDAVYVYGFMAHPDSKHKADGDEVKAIAWVHLAHLDLFMRAGQTTPAPAGAIPYRAALTISPELRKTVCKTLGRTWPFPSVEAVDPTKMQTDDEKAKAKEQEELKPTVLSWYGAALGLRYATIRDQGRSRGSPLACHPTGTVRSSTATSTVAVSFL